MSIINKDKIYTIRSCDMKYGIFLTVCTCAIFSSVAKFRFSNVSLRNETRDKLETVVYNDVFGIYLFTYY